MLLLPSDDGGKPVRAVSYFNAVSLRVLSLYFIRWSRARLRS
jgi:hypothetical protein